MVWNLALRVETMVKLVLLFSGVPCVQDETMADGGKSRANHNLQTRRNPFSPWMP